MKLLQDLLSSVDADISTLDIEAIVNAANEALCMGGGVDGAIRRKADRTWKSNCGGSGIVRPARP
jgi:O-acetyl-ADP-ribose deacetylase (regulator of RNase III)